MKLNKKLSIFYVNYPGNYFIRFFSLIILTLKNKTPNTHKTMQNYIKQKMDSIKQIEKKLIKQNIFKFIIIINQNKKKYDSMFFR